MNNPLLCFCFDATEYEVFRRDEEVRLEIRAEQRISMGYGGGHAPLRLVAAAVYEETGYDLADFSNPATSPASVPSEAMLAGQLNLLRRPTRIVPRFAANAALELRSKLGSMSHCPANLLILEKEYLKLARSINARHSDIIAHQQHVINCYFKEDELDRVARVRTRLPAWMKWTQSLRESSTTPVVC